MGVFDTLWKGSARRSTGVNRRSRASRPQKTADSLAVLAPIGVVAVLALSSWGAEPSINRVDKAVGDGANAGHSAIPAALIDDDQVVGPPQPGAEVDPDLQFLRSVLQNPSNSPEVRRGAAQRIVVRGSADARRIIEEALRSGDPGQIDAVATAVDEESRRPGSMLEALVAALSTTPRELHPKVTRLLAREGDVAAERVAAVGMDAKRTDAERLGAIFAMGQLRGRDQAADLIQLLDERRRESPEVVREACDALERATGQRLGQQPEAWRQWWSARRTATSPEIVVASLQEQIAQLQKERDLEVEKSGKLVQRLRQAYLDLLLPLPAPDRGERLGLMLDDELSDVRNAALSHVERMLRNGERPSDALVVKVSERLTDKVPSIRTRTLRMLDNMAVPKLPERVAELLPAEGDAATAEVMLRLMAARPSPAGFGPAAARLSDPALAEVAAMAVNRIADAGMTPPGWEALVIEPVRRAVDQRATPELVWLRAVAGNDADRDIVMEQLSSADDAVRLGAAEGLRRSGRRRAIIERAAADPVIYPVAIASIADQPASSAVVGSLIDLPPKSEHAEAWNLAMSRVLALLPPKELLMADDRLATLPFVASKTRIEGLRAAAALPPNGGDPALRNDLLARLADLLLGEGDSRGAMRLLADERQREAPALKSRYFRAAVLENEYDLAAKIEPGAEAWIALLEALAAQTPRAARPLADEINHRFGAALSPADRERLVALERSLALNGAG